MRPRFIYLTKVSYNLKTPEYSHLEIDQYKHLDTPAFEVPAMLVEPYEVGQVPSS
jgi:hypothetical protein